MGKTAIEWSDETWNPVTGCDKVSPGCKNCYALQLAPRLRAMRIAKYERARDGAPLTSGPAFGVTLHPDELRKPRRWRKPRRVFVNSMSDPDDRDRRALACEKSNGFEEPPALILEHETVDYRSSGALLEAGRLRIAGESDAQGDQVLRRGKRCVERDAACAEWLSKFLAGGEDCQRQTSELRTASADAGYGWQKVRRAGFRVIGTTSDRGLVVLALDPEDHPPAREPLGTQQSFDLIGAA